MATSSSPSTIKHRWAYDVFVSFRGEDVRKSFMDHLFSDLKRKGIHAFRDDKQLPRGEDISSQLYKAIEESRLLIIIFSENYASSTWCLRELVKILESKEMDKDKYEVCTIFYDVKPSVVRNQTGSYEAAFNRHVGSKKAEVPQWKEALTKAASLSGWDLQELTNGYESKFIDMISKDIFHKLSDGPLHVGENLVGIHSRVEKMNLLRFVGSREVHMIGICGIGGVGKTTIARAIYNLLYIHFEGCSFCEDVTGLAKKHGMVRLQKQIIDDIMNADINIRSVGAGSRIMMQRMLRKQLLLVLDNVDQQDQLEAIAGSRNWFGAGSLIIVTGKDKQLLKACGVEEIHQVEFLYDDEALELFSLYAFKEKHPKKKFIELADRVVKYVKGHPLALKVLGCFLYGKTVCEWETELDRLQRYPICDIQKVLRLSYDGLDLCQKRIFLDIACFFKWEKKDFVAKLLDGCDLFADTNIRVLVDKSLITVSSEMFLKVHDLIQRMGWDIVSEESQKPGERSRLWFPEEVCDVLNKDKGTKAVECLVLDLQLLKVQIRGQSLARMNNLRLLKISNGMEFAEDGMWNSSGNLEFLSNELRWLHWHTYPFKFLPSTFYPENLVALDMSYSNIKHLWIGPKDFKKLKSLVLAHCCNLKKTPDFTGIPNLEELILEGCTNLVEIHPSVKKLKKLLVLNLKNCRNIRSFPRSIESESLQVLNICGCPKLDIWPKRSYNFWPSSLLSEVHHQPSLVFTSFPGFHSLKSLDVRDCNLSEANLNGIGYLSSLETLNLSRNDFTSLPASFSKLSQLQVLKLISCKKLEALPELPPTIFIIDAHDCTSLRKLSKQSTIYKDSRPYLNFTNCPKLVETQSVDSLVSMLLPQGRIDPYVEFNVFLLGSRIPDWFGNQSIGNSVKVDLPSDWCYEKFKGIAACAVFSAVNPSNRHTIAFRVENFDGSVIDGDIVVGYDTTVFDVDEVWLGYLDSYSEWEKAKNFIEVSFEVQGIVKMCGARLVFHEDENSTQMSQQLIPTTDDDLHVTKKTKD